MTISRLTASAVVAVCATGSALAQSAQSPHRAVTSAVGRPDADRLYLPLFDTIALGDAPRNRVSLGPYVPLASKRSHFGDINLDPSNTKEEVFFGEDASSYGRFVRGADRRGDKGPPLGASIGFGAGYVQLAYGADRAFESGNSVLTQQGFAGIGYALSPNVGLRLRGRYLAASGAEFGDDQSFARSQFKSFGAMVGVVWRR